MREEHSETGALFCTQKWGDTMIYKRCPHCGKRVAVGKKCGCGFKREYAAPQGTRKLYHTSRWNKLQKTIVSFYNGLDPYAKSKNKIEYANIVHHIVPAEEDPEHFWDSENLIPLSRSSHDEVHVRYRSSPQEKLKCQNELRSCLRSAEDMLLG